MPLALSSIQLSHVSASHPRFLKDVLANVIADTILSSPAMLGSLEVLGNPTGTAPSLPLVLAASAQLRAVFVYPGARAFTLTLSVLAAVSVAVAVRADAEPRVAACRCCWLVLLLALACCCCCGGQCFSKAMRCRHRFCFRVCSRIVRACTSILRPPWRLSCPEGCECVCVGACVIVQASCGRWPWACSTSSPCPCRPCRWGAPAPAGAAARAPTPTRRSGCWPGSCRAGRPCCPASPRAPCSPLQVGRGGTLRSILVGGGGLQRVHALVQSYLRVRAVVGGRPRHVGLPARRACTLCACVYPRHAAALTTTALQPRRLSFCRSYRACCLPCATTPRAANCVLPPLPSLRAPAAAGVASTLSRNLDRLSLDDAHVRERELARHMAAGSGVGAAVWQVRVCRACGSCLFRVCVRGGWAPCACASRVCVWLHSSEPLRRPLRKRKRRPATPRAIASPVALCGAPPLPMLIPQPVRIARRHPPSSVPCPLDAAWSRV
jgi:hypothetical protein